MKKNKLFKVISSLFLITVLMYSCVDDDFDTPESNPIPVGDLMTISELKDLYAGGDYIFNDTVSVVATVTMDDKSGNIYKTAYIQDATGGIALHLDASGGLYQGDSIRIQLYGLKIGKYAELFQIDAQDGNGFTLDYYVTKIQTLVNLEPKLVTINEINTTGPKELQGVLVKLEGVQFIAGDTAATYADAENQISLDLVVENSDGDNVIVRTSGYSNFADEKVPNGSGSLIAIVGQYNTTMQLYIRSADEVIMDDERLTGGGGPVDGEGTFDNPYNVASGISEQGKTGVWVEGYIVGVYETLDGSGNDLSEFIPSFTAPFNTPYNMIIADDANETSISNCLIIKLTSGEIRNTLNLVDNESNKGKIVKTYGDLTSYFSKPGQQEVSGYWFEGDGINPEDPAGMEVLGTSTVVTTLNEDFTGVTADADFVGTGWLNANVQGERYWQGKLYSGNNYIQATAFGATAATIESWVVTPGIDCSVDKQLSFGTKVGYWKHNGLSVLISSNFDGNPSNLTSSTWTDITSQCTIPTTPTSGYGTDFTPSGNIDLSSYTGQTIYILFKYVGDNSNNTTTYQIDNVQVTDL